IFLIRRPQQRSWTMFRFSVFGWLKSGQQPSRTSQRQRRRGKPVVPRRTDLRIEVLEDRTLPSTITVLNLADSGPGSLRAAVSAANAAAGADTVQFAPGLHGAITLTSELSVTDDLTINGSGANQLAVSGGDVTRIFDISAGAVTIDRLTITHGLANSGALH